MIERAEEEYECEKKVAGGGSGAGGCIFFVEAIKRLAVWFYQNFEFISREI